MKILINNQFHFTDYKYITYLQTYRWISAQKWCPPCIFRFLR